MSAKQFRTIVYLPVVLFLFSIISLNVFAQSETVTGKVTDKKGNALANATVTLKGTKNSTTTTEQGIFSLSNVPASGTLIISYVGYANNEIKYTVGKAVNVSLEESVAEGEDVIVTGVFDKRKKLESSVAISTLSAKQMAQLSPTSAADLLRNIPGIYVNNARGEIANTVYSRGISANSIDNASGYYYVSMQEDGLPVTNVNYNTDNFLRADITTSRLEAVRGGTASIFGANAPGGIFNYISQTGGSTFAGEARLKFGLEGDGKNPYYRADLNFGGPFEGPATS